MAKLYEVIENKRLIGYMFECPGCRCGHIMYTQLPNPLGKVWKFNNNIDMPSFSPSLKATYPGQSFCHFTVANGSINFYPDSTHELKNKRVQMEDVTN